MHAANAAPLAASGQAFRRAMRGAHPLHGWRRRRASSTRLYSDQPFEERALPNVAVMTLAEDASGVLGLLMARTRAGGR